MHSYDFQAVVGSDETILWQGRPNKKCFILESIFNPLLPFAILWTVIDLGGIGFGLVPNVVKHEIETGVLIYLTVFFLFHMMPVWIYGAGVVLAFRNYHFNEYIVTDKAVYVSDYHKGYSYVKRTYEEMGNATLRRGLFDRWIGVGDVVFSAKNGGQNGAGEISISDISEYDRVLRQTEELVAAARAEKKRKMDEEA